MSEFGKGYAYCLGLFLAHEYRINEYQRANAKIGSEVMDASLWFNAAADHLFELVAPTSLSKKEKKKVTEFKAKCLAFRCCMKKQKCTWEDAGWAIQTAKDMLFEWDIKNGIKAVKGDYE